MTNFQFIVYDDDISKYSDEIFESIKHVNEYKQEFWYVRELQEVLGYSQWRRFMNTIEKAMEACAASGNVVDEHFANVGKMITIARGAVREVEDYMLTRYACYLIVMNGDPRKKVIALGQIFFVRHRQMKSFEEIRLLGKKKPEMYIIK